MYLITYCLFFLVLFTPSIFSACLLCTCTVSSTPLSFGSYHPISGAQKTTSGDISVQCSTASIVSIMSSYTISLSAGGSSNYADRRMNDGSNDLSYNIYTDSSHANIWGDGTGGTSVVSDSYNLIRLFPQVRNYPDYGLLPASQNVIPGTYSDSIIATVIY